MNGNTASLADATIESDAYYFDLAADHRPLPGADLVWMSGLNRLASASVVQRIDTQASPVALLSSVHQAAAEIGLPLCRLYLAERVPELEKILSAVGYVMREEFVMAASDRVRSGWLPQIPLTLEPVRDDEGWNQRRQLFDREEKGPDGYVVNRNEYIEMERRKTATGKIRFYLARDGDGDVVASVGVIQVDSAFRLKNLIVRFGRRGQGIASRLLGTMGQTMAGHESMIAFALRKSTLPSLYDRMNFEHVASYYEWSKKIG